MTVETDRRSKLRKRPLSLVYVELTSGNGGMMRDLCEEGFALRAMMPLRPGEVTGFSFALDPANRIEGEGRMIWVEEGGRVAGLEFTSINPEYLDRIRAWLQGAEDIPPAEPLDSDSAPAEPPSENTVMDQLRHEARTVGVRSKSPRSGSGKSANRTDVPHIEPPPVSSLPKMETPRPAHPKGDVTVFPTPKTESAPSREAPTAEELKKEIAEALRQAAAERAAQEEAPPSPKPPAPPAYAPPPALQPAYTPPPQSYAPPPAYTPPPQSYAAPPPEYRQAPPPPSTPSRNWDRSLPPLDPLPYEGMNMPYRHPKRASASSRILGIMLLIGLGGVGYIYRYDLGQWMIEAGQKMSNSDEANTPPKSLPGQQPVTDSGQAQQPPYASAPTGVKPNAASPAAASGTNVPVDSPSPDIAAANAANAPAQRQVGRGASSNVLPVPPLMAGAQNSADPANEAGQSEYQQGVNLLRSSKARDDQAEAARLLWTAVEKGNSNAEVALAELYRLGQGVAQNCDQARVLLNAAARKGNPEGTRHLQLFEQSGCE